MSRRSIKTESLFFLFFIIFPVICLGQIPWDKYPLYEPEEKVVPGRVIVNFNSGVDIYSPEVTDLLESIGYIFDEPVFPGIEPPESPYITRQMLDEARRESKTLENKLNAKRNHLDALDKAIAATNSDKAREKLIEKRNELLKEILELEINYKLRQRASTAPLGAPIPDLTGMYRIYIEEETDPLQVCMLLNRSPLVDYSRPVRYVQPELDLPFFPNDPRFSESVSPQTRTLEYWVGGAEYDDQWGLTVMKVPEAWAVWDTMGQTESDIGDSVIVAVHDSGIDYTHPEFGFEDHNLNCILDAGDIDFDGDTILDYGNIWVNPYESSPLFCQNDEDDDDPPTRYVGPGHGNITPFPPYIDDYIGWNHGPVDPDIARDLMEVAGTKGHGTAVSGSFAAMTNNANAIAGISWNTKVMSIQRVPPTDDPGLFEYALFNYAHIFNYSKTGGPEEDVIDAAVADGLIITVAAGNHFSETGRGNMSGHRNTFAVGQLIIDSQPLIPNIYRQVQAWGSKMWVITPVQSLVPIAWNSTLSPGPDGVGRLSGSSIAAPILAGVIALIKDINMNLGFDQVKQILRLSAIDVLYPEGYGDGGSDYQYPGWDRWSGYGYPDAQKAVLIAKEVAPLTDGYSCTARITDPPLIDDSTGEYPVVSGNYEIQGLATTSKAGDPLYVIQHGSGYEVDDLLWEPLAVENAKVEPAGMLTNWNTVITADGLVTVHLTVDDSTAVTIDTGAGPEIINLDCVDRTVVNVDNIGFNNVYNGYLYGDEIIEIRGYLDWPGNITGFQMAWAPAPDFDAWQPPDGFSNLFSGTIPGTDLHLADFDTSVLPDNTDVLIRMTLTTDFNGGFTNTDYVYIRKDSSIMNGWPIRTDHPFFSELAVEDLNNDGYFEIIGYSVETSTTSADSKLHVFNYDGTEYDSNGEYPSGSWPVSFSNKQTGVISLSTRGSFPAVAVSDIDMVSDNRKEIIVLEYDPYSATRNKLHIFGDNGLEFSNYPVDITYSNCVCSQPIIDNFDADIEKEILLKCTEYNANSHYLLFEKDGSYSQLFQNPSASPNGGYYNQIALGDIDGDGQNEIVSVDSNSDSLDDNGYLFVFDLAGNKLPGWENGKGPYNFFGHGRSGLRMWNIVLADYDEIPGKEIIIGDDNGDIHVLNYLGNHIGPSPINLNSAEITYSIKGVGAYDINGDCKKEIIANLIKEGINRVGHVAIIHGDGTSIIFDPSDGYKFPEYIETYFSFADIDSDGKSEILFGCNYWYWYYNDYRNEYGDRLNNTTYPYATLWAINDDGTTVTGFPKNLIGKATNSKVINSTPNIQDINNDGIADVVMSIGYYDQGSTVSYPYKENNMNGGQIVAFSLPTTNPLSPASTWNTNQGNNERTGTLPSMCCYEPGDLYASYGGYQNHLPILKMVETTTPHHPEWGLITVMEQFVNAWEILAMTPNVNKTVQNGYVYIYATMIFSHPLALSPIDRKLYFTYQYLNWNSSDFHYALGRVDATGNMEFVMESDSGEDFAEMQKDVVFTPQGKLYGVSNFELVEIDIISKDIIPTGFSVFGYPTHEALEVTNEGLYAPFEDELVRYLIDVDGYVIGEDTSVSIVLPGLSVSSHIVALAADPITNDVYMLTAGPDLPGGEIGYVVWHYNSTTETITNYATIKCWTCGGTGFPEIEVDPFTGDLIIMDYPYDLDINAPASSWNFYQVLPGDNSDPTDHIIYRPILKFDAGAAIGEFVFIPIPW